MLPRRRPLIYIPSKKKVIQQGGGETESLGAVKLPTSYLNYNPSNYDYPAIICLSPFHTDFVISGKNMWNFRSGATYSTLVIPIKHTSTMNLSQRAGDMRWAPLPLETWTSTANVSIGTCFYIPNGANITEIVKIKDSRRSDPYVLDIHYTNEAIAGTSSPTFQLRKFSNTTAIGQIQSALQSAGYTQATGLLVCTNRDFGLWTNQVLLDFARYYLQDGYGRKTQVIELDIGI